MWACRVDTEEFTCTAHVVQAPACGALPMRPRIQFILSSSHLCACGPEFTFPNPLRGSALAKSAAHCRCVEYYKAQPRLLLECVRYTTQGYEFKMGDSSSQVKCECGKCYGFGHQRGDFPSHFTRPPPPSAKLSAHNEKH